MRTIKWIVLHCTAGPQNQSTEVIQAYWKSKGYLKPGYHHLISPDGKVEDLWPIEKPSNGVANFNANSIHICYKGGVGPKGEILDNRTDAQKQQMRQLVDKYHALFPDAVILGHRDFSPDKNRNGVIESFEWMKACPSFSVKEWLAEVGVKKLVPVPQVKKAVKTMTGGPVRMRSGPDTNHSILTLLADGTAGLVLEERNGWTYLQVTDDQKGWVKSDFLK